MGNGAAKDECYEKEIRENSRRTERKGKGRNKRKGEKGKNMQGKSDAEDGEGRDEL